MPQYQTGSSRADSVNNPVIAGELRRFRESLNGVTGDRVAADLKWSPSKVSRLERGRTATRRKALAQILSYYAQWHGMAPEKAEALMRMFDAAMEQSGLLNAWLGPSVLAATVTEWARRTRCRACCRSRPTPGPSCARCSRSPRCRRPRSRTRPPRSLAGRPG